MPDEVREHLTRDQRPFLHPESLQILQIHSSMTVLLLFSSPHSFSTGFSSEDWNGQQKLGFVPSDPFLCCFWGLCLDYCTISRRFLTESVTCWFFICWYLIESMMPCVQDILCPQDVQDLQQKYRPTTSKIQQYISLYTWGTFYPCVHQTHLECLLLKSYIFSFIWP